MMMPEPELKLEEAFLLATQNVMQREYPVVAARFAWYTFVQHGRDRLYQLALGPVQVINQIINDVKNQFIESQLRECIPARQRALLPHFQPAQWSQFSYSPDNLPTAQFLNNNQTQTMSLRDQCSQTVVNVWNQGERSGQPSWPSQNPMSYSNLHNQLFAGMDIAIPGSIEDLELKIIELIREKKGHPIPLDSMQNYPRVLQGYFTDLSDPHLTRKLRQAIHRIDNVILVERTDGRELIMLANNMALVEPDKIFITFKDAQNTIKSEDVAAHFRQFGEVEDGNVQIHNHPRGPGKYGFVKFSNAADLTTIISMTPHTILGRTVSLHQCLIKSAHWNPALQFPEIYGLRNLIYLPEGGVGILPGGDNIVRTYAEFHEEMTNYIWHLAEHRRAEDLITLLHL